MQTHTHRKTMRMPTQIADAMEYTPSVESQKSYEDQRRDSNDDAAIEIARQNMEGIEISSNERSVDLRPTSINTIA